MSDVRRAHCVRTTKETDIDLTFTIDGSGKSMISTDIGFFSTICWRALPDTDFDLDVKIKGDLIVDCHHTIEDCGIVLGRLSSRHWAIKRESVAMAPVSYLWMRL